jgi:hypothetical protein
MMRVSDLVDDIHGLSCPECAHPIQDHFAGEALAKNFGCTAGHHDCHCARTQPEILEHHLKLSAPGRAAALEKALRYTTQQLHIVGHHPRSIETCSVPICSNNFGLIGEVPAHE